MRNIPIIEMTVCILRRGDEVLLAKKKKKVGVEKRVPYGGCFEEGETGLQCAVREVFEETGGDAGLPGVIVRPEDLTKVCIADFHNTKTDGTKVIYRVHFYIADKWTGEINETETMMDPQWFNIHDLPYDDMMAADRDYFPQLLIEGKKLRVEAWYMQGGQQSLERETRIREVSEFSSL
jgi:8-oxo-dGTP diphosphatase